MRTIPGIGNAHRRSPAGPQAIGDLDDAAIAEMLLPIPGDRPLVGQMVLIFGLCRMDVLPVGDLGFRQGVRDLFGWNDKARAVELEALAEMWRPYRTVATWYIWRSRHETAQRSLARQMSCLSQTGWKTSSFCRC